MRIVFPRPPPLGKLRIVLCAHCKYVPYIPERMMNIVAAAVVVVVVADVVVPAAVDA